MEKNVNFVSVAALTRKYPTKYVIPIRSIINRVNMLRSFAEKIGKFNKRNTILIYCAAGSDKTLLVEHKEKIASRAVYIT